MITSTHVNSDDICLSLMSWISVAYLFVLNVCSSIMNTTNAKSSVAGGLQIDRGIHGPREHFV